MGKDTKRDCKVAKSKIRSKKSKVDLFREKLLDRLGQMQKQMDYVREEITVLSRLSRTQAKLIQGLQNSRSGEGEEEPYSRPYRLRSSQRDSDEWEREVALGIDV